jgi:pimeloyl-ACP methyl ester carboxylesterase
MAVLDRNGVSIYYETQGAGPVILLTHGYGASSHMWDGQSAVLSKSFQVITWDMRGHGKTDSPAALDEYSEAKTVEDMLEILKACGATKVILGGFSLGGFMSLAFNVAHPEMVSAMMLLDTGPGYRNPVGRQTWNDRAIDRADRLLRDGWSALEGGIEADITKHRSIEGMSKSARGMLTQSDARIIESLPSIAVPTLVLVGAEDDRFVAAADYMANQIPGARKVVIEGAGHASNIEKPDAFNEAVVTFLRENGLLAD